MPGKVFTTEEKERLLALAGVIRDRSATGNPAMELIQLYRELSGDTSLKPTSCRSCMEDMMNYLNWSLDAVQ